jgi:hypothetical protein
MALLLRNQAVFLHIPKTGGTWVRNVLKQFDLVEGNLGHGHSPYDRAFWHEKLHHDLKVARYMFRRAIRSRRMQPRMDPQAFKFCFVREPLSWYESYWRFMESIDWAWKTWGDEMDPYRWDPCAMINQQGSPDFNAFMHNVNKKRPGFVTELYSWYVRPGVDFVGKNENLTNDLIEAFRLMKLNIDPKLILAVPRQNETPSHIPKPEWDPALRRETMRLEYASYVRYGYPIDEAVLA